jgi:hypothetical protein
VCGAVCGRQAGWGSRYQICEQIIHVSRLYEENAALFGLNRVDLTMIGRW